MTDRLKGVHVAFEKNIREDDAETIINAIRMIKGVADVKTSIANPDDWMNREQVKREIKSKLLDLYESI